jgi:hypothetical protein
MKIYIKKQIFRFFNIDTNSEKKMKFSSLVPCTKSPRNLRIKFKKKNFWQFTLGQ